MQWITIILTFHLNCDRILIRKIGYYNIMGTREIFAFLTCYFLSRNSVNQGMLLDNMVEFYDTTLRDGSQAEGVAFSVEDKLIIIEALDKLGIRYIEGGYPGSNPKDIEFFKRAKDMTLDTATVVAFGSTRYPTYEPNDDPNLIALLDTGARIVTIFGKTWRLHATDVLRVSAEENLELIESSVRYLVEHGREVIYDAEHFLMAMLMTQNMLLKHFTLRLLVEQYV